MNRALRAAIVGVALFSPVALSACSAGQVAQTATQDRDKAGGMAEVGDITLRAVQLVYPRGEAYEAGDDAEVSMAIVNTGPEADTLTSVEGEGFASAEVTGTSAETTSGGVTVGTAPVGAADEIELPPNTTVYVGSDDLSITLSDLDEALTVGQAVTLTLTFENAGEVTVRAPVATPLSEVERGDSFDFHHEEGEGEGAEGAEDIARERESDIGDED